MNIKWILFSFSISMFTFTVNAQKNAFTHFMDMVQDDHISASDRQNSLGDFELDSRRAMLELLAMSYGLYPDSHLMFTIRDFDHVWALSQIIEPPKGTTVSALGVSKTALGVKGEHLAEANVSDEQLALYKRYLAGLGLDTEGLEELQQKNGNAIIFTAGYQGTIDKLVTDNLDVDDKLKSVIRSHMIRAGSGKPFASFRTFVTSAMIGNAKLLDKIAENSGKLFSLREYKDYPVKFDHNIPHYTKTISQYVEEGNNVVPFAGANKVLDKRQSIALLEDMKFYAQRENIQNVFKERLEMWQKIRVFLDKKNGAGLANFLQKRINESETDQQLAINRSIVLDVADILKYIFPGTIDPVLIKYVSLDKIAANKAPKPPISIAKINVMTAKISTQFSAGDRVYRITDAKEFGPNRGYVFTPVVDKEENAYVMYSAAKSGKGKNKKGLDFLAQLRGDLNAIQGFDNVYGSEISFQNDEHLVLSVPKGQSGSEWFSAWSETGFKPDFSGVLELASLIRRLARRGYLMSAINFDSLVLVEKPRSSRSRRRSSERSNKVRKRWHIVGPVGLEQNNSRLDIAAHYADFFEDKESSFNLEETTACVNAFVESQIFVVE